MVEFRKKTIAIQDACLDKTNPDLYDGGSGYILVGDSSEPKLGAFRFQIAEAPSFGDATLKYGSMGFYNLATTSLSGSNLPQFSIYKMKSSPDGIDWGAGGSIHPIKRGKVITKVVESSAGNDLSVFTVSNHQLQTGEPVSWTPFVKYYGDADLVGITEEVEYYAIRIDEDTLKFASSISNALAGTAVDITDSTAITFTNAYVSPPISEARYGYMRSKKYRSDIHIITAWGDDDEAIAENFDGSQKRESELQFEAIQRQVRRKGKPYIKSPFKKKVYYSKDASSTTASYEDYLDDHFGTTDTELGRIAWLVSHKTRANGSGWWRTDNDGRDYVIPKTVPQDSSTPNSDVLFNDELLTGTERYGDEVTPMNSMWHTVRGAPEFQKSAETEEAENDLQATGAVRFSTQNKLTGGQSMNMYNFWKTGAEGVLYNSPHGSVSARFKTDKKGQECMVQYKNLPIPSPGMAGVSIGAEFPNFNPTARIKTATGKPAGTGSGDVQYLTPIKMIDGMSLRIKITMNIERLAKAFAEVDATTPATLDTYLLNRRGIFVCMADTPVSKGETLYEYVIRLGGATLSSPTNWANGNHIMEVTTGNRSAIGFWIINTDSGLRIYSLGSSSDDDGTHLRITGQDFYVQDQQNITADIDDLAADRLNNGLDLGLDEWATFIITCASGTSDAHLNVVSQDNMELFPPSITSAGDVTEESNLKTGMSLKNITAETTDGGRTLHDPSKWTDNLSIWTFNCESQFKVAQQDHLSDDEDMDMESSLFIDSIAISGVNVSHQNSTKVANTGYMGMKIGSSSMDGSWQVDGTKFTQKRSSVGKITKTSDTFILLGFEDPSQISSLSSIKKSHRYLFWQGYTSANPPSDGPIAWSAGATLPADLYCDSTDATRGWFTAVSAFGTVNYGAAGRYDHITAYGPQVQYHDSGSPFVYSPFVSLFPTAVDRTAPAWLATYGDGHVTLGMQISNEALNHRNLYFNKTAAGATNVVAGGHGEGQRMFTVAPRIGIKFIGDAISGNQITCTGGAYGTSHGWNTGQKVIYFNNSHTSISVNGSLASSADNTFKDTPTTYYVLKTAATTLKLAIADPGTGSGTIATLGVGGGGTHILYDYDYYVNRKYWMNGWASKGFSRMILDPVRALNGTGKNIQHLYIDDVGTGMTANTGQAGTDGTSSDYSPDGSNDYSSLYLTKREHAACACKVLEILDGPTTGVSQANTSDAEHTAGSAAVIVARVDTVEPLLSTEGTTYRAFVVGGHAGSYNGDVSGDRLTDFKGGLTVSVVDSNTISIQGWDGYGNGTSGKNLISETYLPQLWIGPEKYWVYFKIMGRTGDTEDSYRVLPNKMFDGVCVVSPYGGSSATSADNEAWGTPGATYNESTANFETVSGVPAAYLNKWSVEPSLKPNQTVFDLQDYGFGGAEAAEEGDRTAVNNIRGGMVSRFVPRDNQVNYVNLLNVFNVGEKKEVGDYLDLMLSVEDTSNDSVLTLSSTDNVSLPKPFLLTVFDDPKPANPTDFKVAPYEKDAFLPEFKWSSEDGDLWYGFIMIDDVPISNQYHRSILHVPLNEDLRNVASSYDDTKGWFYSDNSSPSVYGYRYYNTTKVPSGIHAGQALNSSTEKISASIAIVHDNIEGLGGNTKHFDYNDGTYVQFPFSHTAGSSEFTYPIDEMSVVVHITPDSWADSGQQRYIAAFNAPTDNTIVADAWGIYLDDNGRINAYIYGTPASSVPSTSLKIELKSTTKVPVDGTPTCVILTVDTQLHSSNVKLFINGRLEDQTGLRTSTGSNNNWKTDASGVGGKPIFYDTDGTEDLFIGAKSQQSSSSVKATASFTFTSVATLDGTIQLIDGAGTPVQRVYQFKDNVTSGTVDGANIHVNRGSTFSDSASELKTAIDHANGHAGSIVVTISDGSVSLQQSTAGSHNTTITLDQHSGVDITTSTSPNPPATFTGGDTNVKNSFKGKIEEFVWYDKCIYPIIPQNGSLTLDKPLEELADGLPNTSSKAYTARLFIKDYHNIRGKTTGEVAASSQVSFKKAAFELNTVEV